jgi:hypothetical protein
LCRFEPEVRNRTRGNCGANFGFAALVRNKHARRRPVNPIEATSDLSPVSPQSMPALGQNAKNSN